MSHRRLPRATGRQVSAVSSGGAWHPSSTSQATSSIPRVSLPQPKGAPNIYEAPASGVFSPTVAGIPERVYVPNVSSGTVSIIDPTTFKVVRTLVVGGRPHHITPSWDLRHLYVDNPGNGLLEEINPSNRKLGRMIRVPTPYNLYFTPDGSKAIDVAEYDRKIEFRSPRTWRLIQVVAIPGRGVDHLDFSADGSYLLVSSEYTGDVTKVSTTKMRVTGHVNVGGRPIDVKLSPDGKVFYAANQGLGGVSIIDPVRMKQIAFLRTGSGAHGFAVSRNSRYLYCSDRMAGTIAVISFKSRKVVDTWRVGGSPDMLQVSPNGKQLWASNRFGNTVSVISTRTGRVIHSIVVGKEPHGLAYFPQPGRFSVGHNGVYR
jgi:YVTN family beta-propeller protein